jgi:hypothetical protein
MRVAIVCCVVGLGLAVTVPALAKEKIRLTAADTAAARALVIRRSDLRPRPGWSGGRVKPGFSEPVCPFYHPMGSDLVVTGAAVSAWGRSDRSLGSTADVLQSKSMAQRDFRRRADVAGLVCAFRSARAKRYDAHTIPFPKLTAQTAAYRATYTASDGGRHALELVLIGSGRTLITVIETVRAGFPLDVLHADVVRAARIMVNRIKI